MFGLRHIVADRPRVAKQLLCALDSLLDERPNEHSLGDLVVWHLGCLYLPRWTGCQTYTAWLTRLRRALGRHVLGAGAAATRRP